MRLTSARNIHMLLRTTYRTTYGRVPQILPCLPWYTYYKIVVYLSAISCITISYIKIVGVQNMRLTSAGNIHMLLRTTYRTTYGRVPPILRCLPWYTYYKIVVYLSAISCITISYSNRGAVQKQFAHHTLNEVSLYKQHNKDLVYQISLHGIPTAKCGKESGIHIYFYACNRKHTVCMKPPACTVPVNILVMGALEKITKPNKSHIEHRTKGHYPDQYNCQARCSWKLPFTLRRPPTGYP